MFLFYDHKQDDKNSNFYKGKLFEGLLAEYLGKNGYQVSIRQKHNSLEYDLDGIDKTTSMKIIGEAKAHEASIDGQTISAFVGKLIPLGLVEKKVHGVFLSTSPLTPEAKDYFNSVSGMGLTCFTGEELFNKIITTLNLPTKAQLFNNVKRMEYSPLMEYLLTTNYGYSRIVIASINTSINPSHFFVFTSDLKLVDDVSLLNQYQNNISVLSALEPVYPKNARKQKKEFRIIQEGLLLGKDWTDYRLPAAPEFFVGRKALVDEIISITRNKGFKSNVIQIKSRSGVGKSSVLALLRDKFKELGYNVELHDARDIKSVIDVFAIIGRFVGSSTIPQDFTQVENELVKCVKSTNSINVLMVDQFESTFLLPEIFNAYETVAKIIYKYKDNIFFCLARKNDQLTTYDNTLISLQQLNSISSNFELKDFTKEEAKDLLDKINESSSKSISSEVLSYILEFAQGFPWLLKRTMAHILKLTMEENISQKQLISTGLMLDDLFEEELEGLEEIEKEYLVRISSRLPADFHQLQRYFDEDPLLPKMLDKFTQVRLLRLSGVTYDTYNDVFKEYLVYKKLPEFKHQYIYRQHPNSVIRFFEKIVNKNKFTIDQLSKSLNTSQKTLANYIKECRILNLVKKEDNYWVVPKNIRDIYAQGHLGEYIRRQLLSNDLVSSLVVQLSKNKMRQEDMSKYMKDYYPYVEANNATWVSYSNILIAWLEATRIIDVTNNSTITLSKTSAEDLTNSLGNLNNINLSKRRFLRHGQVYLIPSVSWKYIESCFDMIKSGETEFKGENKKAYSDLKNSGILNRINDIRNIDELKDIVRQEFLNNEQYSNIWNAAGNNKNILEAVSALFPPNMSIETIIWRTKKILNWGKALGFIKNKRYTYK
ncbi:MAG TPA: restriction endonuclease [Gallicola sp.]|nr:restriction endonuclease [Gallicola sp.]